MKKIACLSTLVCVLAVSAGSALARSTVSVGYAQGDLQGAVNRANGFNVKYRWEGENDPLGWLGGLTYVTNNNSSNDIYNKGQYFGLTGGPAYRLTDWASIYGVIGIGYGRFTHNAPGNAEANKGTSSDVGFSYGAGLQFNPVEDISIDAGYEKSRVRSVDIGTWIIGVGYSF